MHSTWLAHLIRLDLAVLMILGEECNSISASLGGLNYYIYKLERKSLKNFSVFYGADGEYGCLTHINRTVWYSVSTFQRLRLS
jgi:hypothetical protein